MRTPAKRQTKSDDGYAEYLAELSAQTAKDPIEKRRHMDEMRVARKMSKETEAIEVDRERVESAKRIFYTVAFDKSQPASIYRSAERLVKSAFDGDDATYAEQFEKIKTHYELQASERYIKGMMQEQSSVAERAQLKELFGSEVPTTSEAP